jgi:protein tyrosine phosphatase (PTP) superfamily phosphohydrolase (DUF442 family)
LLSCGLLSPLYFLTLFKGYYEHMKRSGLWVLGLPAAGLLVAAVCVVHYWPAPLTPPTATATNPATHAQWAKPLSAPGLTNFFQVSPTLYRGAQPDAEGMRQLKAMGVRSVINLRELPWHDDRMIVGNTGLKCYRIRLMAWDNPEGEDVDQFLRLVSDPANLPAFVHCQYGSDRTGAMCAIYRIAIDGWTPWQAQQEMLEGGFGFHGMWENLADYIGKLDPQLLRRKAEEYAKKEPAPSSP